MPCFMRISDGMVVSTQSQTEELNTSSQTGRALGFESRSQDSLSLSESALGQAFGSILRLAKRGSQHHTEPGQNPAKIWLLRLGPTGGSKDVARAIIGATAEHFHRA